jgi:alkyl sulfatase BDS1-like metallo-beta-lactamase superfamily hydrolase
VVDPLTSRETATRAMAFARKHLGNKPVVAIIFTHSHVDHFGGALAIASPEEVASGKVKVIAPAGFMEEATSENILAGPAMGRRAIYMYGRDLPRSPRGKVDNGLGKEPAMGTIGILRPTELVDRTPLAMNLDGVEFVFQYTPGSEAPAEMTFYLPAHKAFCGAEVMSRTLHNLYTLRGAKVRDANRWAGYISDAADRFPESDVMFFSHHWPVFGKARIGALMKDQHDTYRYIHDQTLRLANQGFAPREIAEQVKLPKSLMKHWWNRDYYGTVKHDVKAVYQMYFGWYDANPASLDPLPRAEQGKRYVAFMGGAGNVLKQSWASFDKGEYRWVAEVLSHLVAAEPKNVEARSLLAQTYDQLGYRAESTRPGVTLT